MKENIGLVLEGGGMRGVYTAGALECFLEHNVYFPYVIGVSAGASYGASYMSQQAGRNKKVSLDYVTDPRYMSWRNFRQTGQFFGMDFIYNQIPNTMVPFDYEAFYGNEAEFKIGATDIQTGESVFYGKQDYKEELLKALEASSSLPFLAPVVDFKGRKLLDGGISDPIPLKRAQEDGFKRNVVILTRNLGYRKSKSRFAFFVRRKYPQFKGLQQAMEARYKLYNETLEYVEQEEKKGNIMVVRPQEKLVVGRMERNPQKLENLYMQGYRDAKAALGKWKEQQFI
ncbi:MULTISPECIES: patatin family protein [unclassified Niallia]|uniref:patatin-like phospholipase family protein n=1 Tax=unclassified Niallia TaxID=2837522 RepID=UPI001EDAC513|nr:MULTISPECIES: patatin family protein [unclassified Niallia]MCM3030629.1 patatin family protein [Niallia sp. MER 6]MDL0437151.1 patatin family protein [Niallia sp. SS-2023]UPO86292.1 patatin family protein [Niallia sp. Man26]